MSKHVIFNRTGLKGSVTEPFPGIHKIAFGKPGPFVPSRFRVEEPSPALQEMPEAPALPFNFDDVQCRVEGGCLSLYIPCDEPEDEIYGFGLDSGAYQQKGLRKILGVCAGNMTQTGMSHAPIPFYLSTKGYGVWVDTARVPTVHVARLDLKQKDAVAERSSEGAPATSVEALYSAQTVSGRQYVVVELSGISGVDVYFFGGSNLLDAVRRYNLFSGGGAMPALWGLGLKYRNYTLSDQKTVLDVASNIRQNRIPCDVIGLEPGWHTQSYSCSFVWDPKRFPEPDRMLRELRSKGFQISLWEHAYIHPTSPLYNQLEKRSGNVLVWKGLVVDFADNTASEIFSRYHQENFVDKGIFGFKADECDNQLPSDCHPFNFPYSSEFPSGISGEEMIQLNGILYQRSLYTMMKELNIRTFSEVRASASLCAPLPFALYSDTYMPAEYLRQLVNSSFSGLLWSPEIRNADTEKELYKRIGMAVFAPHFCFNPWYIPNPIWMQFDAQKNQRNELMDDESRMRVADRIRNLSEWRMRFVPYLYASFYRYNIQGIPPVRALVLDFPDDPKVRGIDTAYMFGESLLVAHVLDSADSRTVYLPAGTGWYEFHSGKYYQGGIEVEGFEQDGLPPLFVKENSLLPLARPLQNIEEKSIFEIEVKVYGKDPAPCILFEDDGVSYDFFKGQCNTVTIAWNNGKGQVERKGSFTGKRYEIRKFETAGQKK